jgi:hypothetical protein
MAPWQPLAAAGVSQVAAVFAALWHAAEMIVYSDCDRAPGAAPLRCQAALPSRAAVQARCASAAASKFSYIWLLPISSRQAKA